MLNAILTNDILGYFNASKLILTDYDFKHKGLNIFDLHAHSDPVSDLAALAHLAAVVGAFSGVPLVGDGGGTEKGFATRIRIEVQRHFAVLVEACMYCGNFTAGLYSSGLACRHLYVWTSCGLVVMKL